MAGAAVAMAEAGDGAVSSPRAGGAVDAAGDGEAAAPDGAGGASAGTIGGRSDGPGRPEEWAARTRCWVRAMAEQRAATAPESFRSTVGAGAADGAPVGLTDGSGAEDGALTGCASVLPGGAPSVRFEGLLQPEASTQVDRRTQDQVKGDGPLR